MLDCHCSMAQFHPTLCDPLDCSMPDFPVHYLPEFAQTHVLSVGDAVQLSHPLSPPSPPALNLSQHQGLFQWVGSSHKWSKYWIFNFSTSLACWIRVALRPMIGILIKRGRFRDTDKQGEVAVMQLRKPRNNKNGWKIPDSRKHWGRILP